MGKVWQLVVFSMFVLALLALDMYVFHRTAHKGSSPAGRIDCGCLDVPRESAAHTPVQHHLRDAQDALESAPIETAN
jgi:hypothetical protein